MSLCKSVLGLTIAVSLGFLLLSNDVRSQNKKTDGKKTDPANKTNTSPNQKTSEPKRVAVSEEYIKLAHTLSNKFISYQPFVDSNYDKEQLVKQDVPFFLQLGFVTEDLKKVKRPVIVNAVKQLKDGISETAKEYELLQKKIGEANLRQAATDDAVARGEFKHKVERVDFVRQSDGTTKQVTSSTDVDNSLMAAMFGSALSGAQKNEYVRKFWNDRNKIMEKARLSAWDTLVPKLQNFYTNDATLENVPVINLTTANELTVSNKGKTELNNVTLILKLAHYTSAPETTSIRVYFFDRIQAGQTFELAPDIHFNCKVEEYEKGRPVAYQSKVEYNNAYFSQTKRVGDLYKPVFIVESPGNNLEGIVQVKHTFYTEQGNQAERTTSFAEQAEWGANQELRSLIRMMNVLMTKKDNPIRTHKEAFANLEFNWGERITNRIPKFAPANSEAAKLAKMALENPEQFCKNFLAKQEQAMDQALAAKSLYRNKDFAMQIDSYRKYENIIRLTFFDPAKPERHEARTARIVTTYDGTRHIEINNALSPDKLPPSRLSQLSPKQSGSDATIALEALTNKYSYSQKEKMTDAQLEQHKDDIRKARDKINQDSIAKAKPREFPKQQVVNYSIATFKKLELYRNGVFNSSDGQFRSIFDPKLTRALTHAIADAEKKQKEKLESISKLEKEYFAKLMATELKGHWKVGYDLVVVSALTSFKAPSIGLFERSRKDRTLQLVNAEKYQGKITVKFEEVDPVTLSYKAVFTLDQKNIMQIKRDGVMISEAPGVYTLVCKSILPTEVFEQQTNDWQNKAYTSKLFTTAELDLMTAQGEIILELFEKEAAGKLLPSSINPRAVWLDIKLERKQ